MDENAELKAALKEHGDQIKAKQAEMLTAVEGKNAELKAEIEKQLVQPIDASGHAF